MFFVKKKFVIYLLMCFFQYVGPPNERIRVFGSSGLAPENPEEPPREWTESVPPLTGGPRRNRSSSRSNVPQPTEPSEQPSLPATNPHMPVGYRPPSTPLNLPQNDDVNSVNNVPIASLRINNRYNLLTYPQVPPATASFTFPYLPNAPPPTFIQPVVTPQQPPPAAFDGFRPPLATQQNTPALDQPQTSTAPWPPVTGNNYTLTTVQVDPEEERRERARKRKQEERARESLEKKKQRNAKNAAAMSRSRATETEEQTQSRRAQNAASTRQSRADETEEQTQSRRAQNAASTRQSRADETEEQTQSRRAQNAASTRQSRADETEDQTQSRRAQNTAAMNEANASLNPEERLQRRALQRDTQRIRREQMTPSQHAAVNQRRRNNYQQRRQQQRERTTLTAALSQAPQVHTMGPMDQSCSNCGAMYFQGECTRRPAGTYERCCNHGKVEVELFDNFPQQLKDLFMRVPSSSSNFHSHIRNFNSSLAMASMDAQLKSFTGGGPFVYCIHGQLNYHSGPAMPQNSSPSFGQLYFIDCGQAADERMGRSANSSCNPATMRQLSNLMATTNRLARAYKKMGDLYREEEEKAKRNNTELPKIKMVFIHNKMTDPRRYNAATTDEVALIYVGPDGDVPHPREFTVFLQGGGFAKLTSKNPRLDALVYPLFFPDGRDTWHPNLTKQNIGNLRRTRVTQANFYGFILSVRPSFNPIHWGGKLFQQFAVDLWIRMESNSLEWVRHNQDKVRSECYQSLRDFVTNGEDGLAGSRIVLPSSHIGSPRHYAQEYQDCMTMVARFGKPDLFITMTTNPKWPEIVENLLTGQTANDRPDIVTRVFNEKWNSLLKDITVDHVLGQVVAFAYTVEWQKRGLPHVHLLVTLAPHHKLNNADNVDQLISAEIPDETDNPELYELVKCHMVHRKCGSNDLHAPCNKNGKCSKNFPKKFANETSLPAGQYPEYKRRNDGRRIRIGSGADAQEYDNRHIVSYSKWLLRKYGCHINVEVSSLIHVCKYLFKYVYKGVDKAVIQLRKQLRAANGGVIDEICEHLDARFMCAPESLHRIFKFKISGRSHSVERLEVHLPDFHTVQFVPGNEQQALDRSAQQKTTLLAFFDLNVRWNEKEANGEDLGPVDPRSLTYLEIPENFVFEKTSGNYHWKQRSMGGDKKIGRLMGVQVRDRERYSLRLLLQKAKGCTSYEDLRTLNGHHFHSFEAAAMGMGLLQSNNAFESTMMEACLTEMPFQLRRLFVSLFLFYLPSISSSLSLWEQFADDLAEDYSHRGIQALIQKQLALGRRPLIEARALAWYDISEALAVQNVDFELFVPAPLPQRPRNDTLDPQIDHSAIAADFRSKLNVEQESSASAILTSADARLCFVDGPGGSGKSFLYKCIYHTLKAQGKQVVCCSWTGIAASLLPEGRTISSLFKLNKKTDNKTSSVKPNTKEGRMLKELDTIIVDEVSMVSSWTLEGIDKCLQDVCNNHLPFGGKRILMGGDFRQVLPIPPRNSGIEPAQISVKCSPLFSLFAKFSLSSNMRASGETREWKELLIDIGNGTAPQDANGKIDFPREILSGGDLISEIFEGVFDDPDHLKDRAILCPKNFRVDAINSDILDAMTTQEMTYYSCDSIEQEAEQDQLEIDPEFLHLQTPRGFPLHKLRLKIGCVVMVIRNLNIQAGLCNGSRLQVVRFARNFIECRFIVGARSGEHVLIPRIELISDDDTLAFKLRRRQFPLRLSFCMTINKSQGQSLQKVGIDLENDVFGHGQMYVALSRSTTKDGIRIYTKDDQPKAVNIVDQRVL